MTVFETAEYAAGLADAGDTCFILTNTRSLPEAAAVELTTAVAGDLLTLDLGGPVEDHQPERLDPARACPGRDRCPQHRPATRRRPPSSTGYC